MLLSATPFTGGQLSLIIIISVVFAVLLIANAVLLCLFFYRRKKRKLCTAALQQKREELLEELYNLRSYKPKPATVAAESTESAAPSVFDEEDEDEAEVKTEIISADGTAIEVRYSEVLAVRDMSLEMRECFGFTQDAFDEKRYYVRYNYGFESKLRAASEEVKAHFTELMNETGWYKNLEVANRFRQKSLRYGRKTIGQLFFKGKTLCLALALDPATNAKTGYRGEDVSHIKRFAKTPMLIKLTSEQSLGYAKYLLNRLAEEYCIELNETPVVGEYTLNTMTRDQLFAAGLMKITVVGEVKEN